MMFFDVARGILVESLQRTVSLLKLSDFVFIAFKVQPCSYSFVNTNILFKNYTTPLRASCGPKWCDLFLILYHTPYSTKLKVNKTDVVTVCHFRIFTIEQIILNPVTVAKHLVVLAVLEYS